MKRAVFLLLVILGLSGGVTLAQDESGEGKKSKPKSETSGLAFGAGVGYQFPLFGAQFLYYLQIPDTLFRVTPYSGAGYWPGDDEIEGQVGLSIGVMSSYGGNHRIVLDLNYALAALEAVSDDGIEYETNTLYGFTLALGYEYMSDGGFFVRPQIGGTYLTDSPSDPDESNLTYTFNLGLGYKIW